MESSARTDNPLYAYLNGHVRIQPHSRSPSSEKKRVLPKAARKDEPANDMLYQDMDSHEELNIRGSGTTSNVFSFRGASSTSVSIKNLAPGTTQADVCTILNEQVGEVEECITFPVRGDVSTTAEVRFGSRIAADKAINILHGVLADSKLPRSHLNRVDKCELKYI